MAKPYSAKKPPKKLKEKIKDRHPGAGANEYRQFIHIFNNVLKETGSEARAYAQAWGVLNKNKKLKSSHRKTDPKETKKDVRKWEKKHKIKTKDEKKKKKGKKKKSTLIYPLLKIANELDQQGIHDIAHELDLIAESLVKRSQVYETLDIPPNTPLLIPETDAERYHLQRSIPVSNIENRPSVEEYAKTPEGQEKLREIRRWISGIEPRQYTPILIKD